MQNGIARLAQPLPSAAAEDWYDAWYTFTLDLVSVLYDLQQAVVAGSGRERTSSPHCSFPISRVYSCSRLSATTASAKKEPSRYLCCRCHATTSHAVMQRSSIVWLEGNSEESSCCCYLLWLPDLCKRMSWGTKFWQAAYMYPYTSFVCCAQQ